MHFQFGSIWELLLLPLPLFQRSRDEQSPLTSILLEINHMLLFTALAGLTGDIYFQGVIWVAGHSIMITNDKWRI